jgi:hypothetical protein
VSPCAYPTADGPALVESARGNVNASSGRWPHSSLTDEKLCPTTQPRLILRESRSLRLLALRLALRPVPETLTLLRVACALLIALRGLDGSRLRSKVLQLAKTFLEGRR